LFEKFFCIFDLPIRGQQLNDFPHPRSPFCGAQSQDHLLFIKKFQPAREPWRQRDFYWIIRATQLYSLSDSLGQLKKTERVERETTFSFAAQLYYPGYVNAIRSFYRGEMGRIRSGGSRLDITTNWAIPAAPPSYHRIFHSRVPHAFLFHLAIRLDGLWSRRAVTRSTTAFRARARQCRGALSLSRIVMENRECSR